MSLNEKEMLEGLEQLFHGFTEGYNNCSKEHYRLETDEWNIQFFHWGTIQFVLKPTPMNCFFAKTFARVYDAPRLEALRKAYGYFVLYDGIAEAKGATPVIKGNSLRGLKRNES